MKHEVIYKAEKDGSVIKGNSDDMVKLIERSKAYIYRHVYNQNLTWNGWRLSRIGYKRKQFVAEKPDDDPVEGDAEEIAFILGISLNTVYESARMKRKTRGGWSIRYFDGQIVLDN